MRKTIIVSLLLTLSLALFGQDVKNPNYRRGFSTEAEVGYVHEGGYLNWSVGANVFHGLYVGLGTGLQRYRFEGTDKMANFIPTYLHVRYSFLDKAVSPFIDLKGGLVSDYTRHFTGHGTDTEGVGVFFGPAVGVEYKHFGVKVGYYHKSIWSYRGEDNSCTVGVFYKF